MTRRSRDNLILTCGLMLTALLTLACDKNIARPDELAQLSSVGIARLEAGDDTLIAGESTTLSWEVTDADGIVQSASITEIGQVALSGDRKISPDASTLYTLDVYVDGEVVKSRSVYVTVLDEEGNEVVDASLSEVPSETACGDGADDDGDEATDCDDSDCAQDALCTEITYAFSNVTSSATGATVMVGDTVTVTWESNFDKVKVARDDLIQAKLYSPGDTYSFTAEDDPTTIVLIGMVDGGEYASSDAITVDALAEEPEPDFDEDVTVSLSATPSFVVYGQSYSVSWTVEGAESVTFDGNATSSPVTKTAETSEGSITHTLSVTDKSGNTEDYTVTVTVAAFFEDTEVTGIPDGVATMVNGPSTDEYYFLSDSAIARTEDALAAGASEWTTSGIKYDITALAESNGKIFAGTSEGLYVQESEDASFKPIISTPGNDITCLYAQSDGTVLVGTVSEIFEVTSCSSATGYCQGDKDSPAVSAGTDFYAFVADPSDASHVIALTGEGPYESADGGASFAHVHEAEDVDEGLWMSDGLYLWGSTRVYGYEDGAFTRRRDLETDGINAIVSAGDYEFIATDEGVIAVYDGTDFATNLIEAVRFLIVDASDDVVAVTGSGGVFKIGVNATEAAATQAAPEDVTARRVGSGGSIKTSPAVWPGRLMVKGR